MSASSRSDDTSVSSRTRSMTAMASAAVLSGQSDIPLSGSSTTVAPRRSAIRAACARLSIAVSSWVPALRPSRRLPYSVEYLGAQLISDTEGDVNVVAEEFSAAGVGDRTALAGGHVARSEIESGEPDPGVADRTHGYRTGPRGRRRRWVRRPGFRWPATVLLTPTVMSVVALPVSICVTAMSMSRKSSSIEAVSPLIACLVMV